MSETLQHTSTLRSKVYWWLERPDRKALGPKVLEIAIIILIIANVVAVILESVSSILSAYRGVFVWIEAISITLFIAEYAARLWVAPENPEQPSRLKWARSPMAIIDLLAILPTLLIFIFPMDLRILRVFRLLRILKLTRYSAAFSMLGAVFEEEAGAFLACLFILMVMLIFAASGIWLAEHNRQPDAFGSILHSMWWAVATLTTVGYGDVSPITPLGKLFGALITVVGIGMAALPAGIIASGLNTQIHLRRENLEREFRKAFEDGAVNASEEAEIEALRKELGLSRRIVDGIRKQIESQLTPEDGCCPTCGQNLP